MNKLTFLGTGAGDTGMLQQRIRTSALHFEIDGISFMVDPGPGAIVNAVAAGIDLLKLDGLIVTHPHPDHYADANCLIDALKKEKTFLLAGKSCLVETKDYYPCINKYQQQIPSATRILEVGQPLRVRGIVFEGVRTNHIGVGLGVKMTGSVAIGYVSDGSLEQLSEEYAGMDILIFNTYIPPGQPSIPGVHASADDIAAFLKRVQPKKAIIQHFSTAVLDADPRKVAERIESISGVPTIAATDGMVIDL